MVLITGTRCRLVAVVVVVSGWLASGLSSAADESPAIVATHYFYWYRWPDQHFNEPGAPGPEGHYHHLPNPHEVSYASAAWHTGQFQAMQRAGIDVALPVYWGAPGAYDRPNIRFSRDGLKPMVEALQSLNGAGIKLGLFYDTSTLQNGVRGVSPPEARADLTSKAGEGLFCNTVIEYFEQIPDRYWARMDGRPLVVLYAAAFAADWDAGLCDRLRQRFEQRFPTQRPLVVADASWGSIGQDLTTSWGAALHGPQLFPGLAQIGPGYNDTQVPGRTTPIRDREDGNFYRYSWRAALAHRPRLVLIETWNEMHEGTDICQTNETGAKYLDLTAQWVTKLKAGADPGPEIVLQHPQPVARPH